MNLEQVKKKFVDQVKLRAYDDKYVDKVEEKEILIEALKDGVDVDAARGALGQVCESQGYVLESFALNQMNNALVTFAENDGKVDEKEFNDCVTILKKATQGKRTDVQCKRMVLESMQENSYQPKTGWFSNWFKANLKEVGMA